MRSLLLALAATMFALSMLGEPATTLRIDFSNPGLTPSQWKLVISPDGAGHFHADRGSAPVEAEGIVEPMVVDRDVQLSRQFVDHVFETVHHHRLLNEGCESHMKVAFQGWKKLTYNGPDGQGSCQFNYSKDRDIQTLGESLVAVASTIIEGVRLEILLQHEPLGLDSEMQYLSEAVGDGRLQQLCAIKGILERLEEDPDVMERVRKRARVLLAQTDK